MEALRCRAQIYEADIALSKLCPLRSLKFFDGTYPTFLLWPVAVSIRGLT